MMSKSSFKLIHDPGPYPLKAGMLLSAWEVRCGLELESFHPGTILMDLHTGQKHTVRCKKNGSLALWPPNRAVLREKRKERK